LKKIELIMHSFIRKSTFLILLFVALLLVSCTSKNEEPETKSAYITKVFDYAYAPGQHAALALPTDIQYFVGDPAKHSGWVYLGGFGGYIVAGFDHNVLNKEGADFEVYALKGSSPEPAIVYVMQDENGDGLPNETWFELKGNQFVNSQRNYKVTYFKPAANSNIKWRDSNAKRAELVPGFGATNSSAWWWPSTKTDSITFVGTRLPDAYDNNSSNGVEYWVVPKDRFTWGYAENLSGSDYDTTIGANKLDISNAVDASGNSINLKNIRFIKVQTAVFQQAGWTNEVSAEVRGAKSLE